LVSIIDQVVEAAVENSSIVVVAQSEEGHPNPSLLTKVLEERSWPELKLVRSVLVDRTISDDIILFVSLGVSDIGVAEKWNVSDSGFHTRLRILQSLGSISTFGVEVSRFRGKI